MNLDQLATIVGAVVGPLAGAVAAYYAIRQDLAVLRVRIDAHDQTLVQALRRADDAHGRIDDVLSKR
jgi:outer membrane lipoprotein SlyB